MYVIMIALYEQAFKFYFNWFLRAVSCSRHIKFCFQCFYWCTGTLNQLCVADTATITGWRPSMQVFFLASLACSSCLSFMSALLDFYLMLRLPSLWHRQEFFEQFMHIHDWLQVWIFVSFVTPMAQRPQKQSADDIAKWLVQWTYVAAVDVRGIQCFYRQHEFNFANM